MCEVDDQHRHRHRRHESKSQFPLPFFSHKSTIHSHKISPQQLSFMKISKQNCGSVDTFLWDDVRVGELIGSGSFASVYRVKITKQCSIADDESTSPSSGRLEHPDIAPIVNHNRRKVSPCGRASSSSTSHFVSANPTGPTRFALKRLNATILASADETKIASAGIAFEAHLLMNVIPPHPNIIRLCGVSDGFFASPAHGFILLEYLEETLEDRIQRWNTLQWTRKTDMTFWQQCQAAGDRRRKLLDQKYRIRQAAIGIAEAMKFLHKHNILHRDLKPGNIGFDYEGRVRLFDFDLARTIGKDDEGKLTMCVGTSRYMSPECWTSTGYSFASDVYSFAVVLWELCTLEKPFSRARNSLQLAKQVVLWRQRPSLRRIASPGIGCLLKTCWEPNPDLRLSFSSIVDFLNSHLRERH
jgi:serine/threonine protein kinase